MKQLERLYKQVFHSSTLLDSSSAKKIETTTASAPVVSQVQDIPPLLPLPAGDILLSTSLVTASQSSTKADTDHEPTSNGDPIVQTFVGESGGIDVTASSGETLPSDLIRPLLQATVEVPPPAVEHTSMDTTRGILDSDPIGFEEIPPSNMTQPNLPLQTPGEVQFLASEHPGADMHRAFALGLNLTGQSTARFFENASNFAVNNSIMGENIQITQIQTHDGAVLKEMVEHTMPGAHYDSSVRDSPPRCHPGTRTNILEDVQARVHDPDIATRMVWIYGPAGVGKSAIMQTLAEAEASKGTIFTTLFFSRPNERDDPKKVFTTLAYGLAVRSLEYRRYIGNKLASDPTFLAKSMDEQFQQLFVAPFLTTATGNHVCFHSLRWVVFLDGLDECRGEAEQRRIVKLIRNHMLDCVASSPFVWIIASRPEAHLKIEFTKAKTDVTSFWELEVPIDSDQSLRDVERYLRVQFSEMRENHSDSIPPLWPSESDFLKVAEASSGLFIFASTLIAYLLGGAPVFRLKHVISMIMAARAQTNPRQNPFQMLDFLYTQIMLDVPKEVLPITKLLLAFYLLSNSHTSMTPLLHAANILGLEQYEAYAALRKLPSVLDCPTPERATNFPVRFLHASFSDFLLDPSRSQIYSIDLSAEFAKLWQLCTEILHLYEIHRSYTCVSLSWLPLGVEPEELQEDVWWHAKEIWMNVLLSREGHHGLLIGEVSLVKALRGLGPTIFWGSSQKCLLREFLQWLDTSPEAQRGFLRGEFTLGSLDINRLHKSLDVQHWCYHITETDHGYCFSDVDLGSMAGSGGASKWLQKEDLDASTLRKMIQEKDNRVSAKIFGFEGIKQCIMIGPYKDFGIMFYYILPYPDEHPG